MQKKLIRSFFPLISLILILIFLSTRDNKDRDVFRRTQLLMGTIVEITIFKGKERESAEEAVDNAFKEIKRLEKLLGRRQEESDIWNINHNPGNYVPISHETMEVVEAGLNFQKVSGGAFDITMGRLMELWNFDGDLESPPPSKDIEAALKESGIDSVIIDKPKSSIKVTGGIHLDLGGIAKGYIIDRAAKILISEGVNNFIINAGGDMMIRGRKGDRPWRVGIQAPRKEGEIFSHIDIDDEVTSIVTSGDYERYFIHEGKRYHHILDPATGYPTEGLMSVTVQAADTMTADAMSTAILVLGQKDGMRLIESMEAIEGLLVDENKKVHISEGLKGKVVVR